MNNEVELFNRRAENYESFSDWCKNEQLYRLCIDPLQDMLPKIKCLDLGGGTGWIARKNSSETGRNWTVLDIAPAMGKSIEAPVTFVLGDAHSLPFVENEFGFVVLRSVLHFVDVRAVLREVIKVLSPGGYLVVAQKIQDSQGDRDWVDELHQLRNPTSPKAWTLKELQQVVTESGFVIHGTVLFKERRSVDLNRWISKDGTVACEKLPRIRELIHNPPDSVINATGQVIDGNKLSYDRTWAICYIRKGCRQEPVIPTVVSMIVERNFNGEKAILVQRRKNRYDEPKFHESWELPQGKLEGAETVREAAVRELMEETSMRLNEFADLTGIANVMSGSGDDEVEALKPLICVRSSLGSNVFAVALIVVADGEPSSVDIDREYRWVPVSNLSKFIVDEFIYPLNRPMLMEYISKGTHA